MALSLSLSRFFVAATEVRWFVSGAIGLAAALFLPRIIYVLFWQRFRNRWVDTYVLGFIGIAWVISESLFDIQMRPEEALTRIVTRVGAVLVAGAISYASRRKTSSKADSTGAKASIN